MSFDTFVALLIGLFIVAAFVTDVARLSRKHRRLRASMRRTGRRP